LQLAVKKLPRILQIPLRMGLGGGDALEGIVEDGDDAALFVLARREADPIALSQLTSRQFGLATTALASCLKLAFDGPQRS
jgi:hypothetical protein